VCFEQNGGSAGFSADPQFLTPPLPFWPTYARFLIWPASGAWGVCVVAAENRAMTFVKTGTVGPGGLGMRTNHSVRSVQNSLRPDLNRRPFPYQGNALPTELHWQNIYIE